MDHKDTAETQAEVCAHHSDYNSHLKKVECGKLHGLAGIVHALIYIGDQLSMIANTYYNREAQNGDS